MNAKLILENLPKVEELIFGSISKCFVGRLLMPDGEREDCLGRTWYDWYMVALIGADLSGLSFDVRENIKKYDLSVGDLLLLSDIFETYRYESSVDEQKGYDAVVDYLTKIAQEQDGKI